MRDVPSRRGVSRDALQERGGVEGVEVPGRKAQAHELRLAPSARVPDRVGAHRVGVQGHNRAAVQGRGDALAVRKINLRQRASRTDAQRGMIQGKECEMETQLVLAVDLGLCDDARARRVAGLLQEVIRVLQGLGAALERRTEG